MRLIALLALATAAACAPAQPPEAGMGGGCDAAALTSLVGRLYADSLQAEALRRSGARAARVIRPGDIVTMDYRGDRLNIHLTAENRVERFACG